MQSERTEHLSGLLNKPAERTPNISRYRLRQEYEASRIADVVAVRSPRRIRSGQDGGA